PIAVLAPTTSAQRLPSSRESNCVKGPVTDEEIMAAQKLLGSTCGVFGEPAGVTGTAGLKKLCEQGKIPADATVVSVVTGNGLKDVENAIRSCGEPISIQGDMERLVKAFAEKGITVS
ncbi:MAG: pyridoxal-phosphate dependent enzyme, partial [Lachnospiraceae bacterium]|nr:pyridoxal-phosphate dependent enzyme [Lachnospiraceae bacterium]